VTIFLPCVVNGSYYARVELRGKIIRRDRSLASPDTDGFSAAKLGQRTSPCRAEFRHCSF